MSNENIEQITVKDSKVEPFYIYLGILFVAGVYAFHAPILSALSRWTSTNKAADEDANDERAAHLARVRMNMQSNQNEKNELERLSKKKKHSRTTSSNDVSQNDASPPLNPRVVDLGSRARRRRPTATSTDSVEVERPTRTSSSSSSRRNSNNRNNNNNNNSSSSVTSATNTNTAHSNSTTSNTMTDLDRQTELDALYAASLQAADQLPSSSSTSTQSLSSMAPRDLRAHQDAAYEASLLQDNARRRQEENKQDEAMQIAIQKSIVEAQEQEALVQETAELNAIQKLVPLEIEDQDGATNVKKIQFRFASGTTLKRNFPGDCTLGNVRAYVVVELYKRQNRIVRCTMSTTHPRRTYGEDDDLLTLEESKMFEGGAKRVQLMIQDLDA